MQEALLEEEKSGFSCRITETMQTQHQFYGPEDFLVRKTPIGQMDNIYTGHSIIAVHISLSGLLFHTHAGFIADE